MHGLYDTMQEMKDEVLRLVEQELDLEEQRLQTDL